MASVRGLGYLIVHATDLAAWEEFTVGLLGLQIAERSPDRLLLRADEKAYRIDVVRSETVDAVAAIGWEVQSPEDLAELADAVEKDGFTVERCTFAEASARKVSGLVRFTDPEGVPLELFYGLKKDRERFVSPTGAHFTTGTEGLGHVFQIVRDTEAYRHLYLDVLGFRVSDYVDFGPDRYGTFLHCNERHHSFAFAPIPQAKAGVGHVMIEVDDIDLVGRAWDKVLKGAAPIASTFGRHSNDEMISFYVRTPSNFQLEYGTGGMVIDPATHLPSRFDTANYWGHERTDPGEPDV
jgi:3,4-dihydroxy-9,10-secoandrosta-1,3,5(10)-triene-9,17-dione 4,5-dioxygenase